MPTILDGIIIGGAGGAIAGVMVWLVQRIQTLVSERRDKRRVLAWLHRYTRDEPGHRFRTTRAIASWNNLTEDRVRFICSIHPDIFLSTGELEDRWGLYGRGGRDAEDQARGGPAETNS